MAIDVEVDGDIADSNIDNNSMQWFFLICLRVFVEGIKEIILIFAMYGQRSVSL